MSRVKRIIIPTYPHHTIMRGNNQKRIFFRCRDNKEYLQIVKRCSERWGCKILSYCLMPNHTHLLLVPGEQKALSKTMQSINLTYTQYLNNRYSRTGRTWESRFHSSVVDKDKYLWHVIRYIETNPVRANLVKNAEDYQYSSARSHLFNTKNYVSESLDFLVEKYGIFEGINYREFLKSSTENPNFSQYITKMVLQNKPTIDNYC